MRLLGRVERVDDADGYMAWAKRRIWTRSRVHDFHENIGPPLAMGQIVTTALMVVLVLLRIYTRHTLMKAFGTDDWLILAGAVVTVGMVVCHCLCVFERLLESIQRR